jgi:hypothetical protein
MTESTGEFEALDADIEAQSLDTGEVPDPNADLMSADTDPLPDEQVSDPYSTPQGPKD